MRILMWTDAFAPQVGGLEVFCLRLITALKERGHDCLVITNRLGKKHLGMERWNGIPVHGLPFEDSQRSGNLASIRSDSLAAGRIIDEFGPDILHYNTINRTLINLLILQRMRRRPALLTLHDGHFLQKLPNILPAVFSNVDKVVAISDSVQQDALASYPGLRDKICILLNALPGTPPKPPPLPGNQNIFVFGRLVPSKGFDVAIRAFARIAEIFPKASLAIAGDGAERASLEALAREAGLGERIRFLGWVSPDTINTLISEYQMVVMPSRWKEPFGLAALQAAQMGRPLVASSTGGIPEIVQDGITGLLFENENDFAMANAMALILKDPGLAARMGEAAHARAREHFDFSTFVDGYERLLAGVAGTDPV